MRFSCKLHSSSSVHHSKSFAGSKQRRIKRGVKEVVKALRKGEKGWGNPYITIINTSYVSYHKRDVDWVICSSTARLVVMAGDISPMDVLTHIPLLAEENGSGYIFVPTKVDFHRTSQWRFVSSWYICIKLIMIGIPWSGVIYETPNELRDDFYFSRW
jgi:hypothetical protein